MLIQKRSRNLWSGTLQLFALVAAVLLAGCTGAEAKVETVNGAERPLPADVAHLAEQMAVSEKTSPPSSGTTHSSFATTGEFISPAQSSVAPKVPGRVAAIYVDAGAIVKNGQPLAAFEADYDRLELQRLEAELQRLIAMSSEAARDYERKKELRGRESIPQARYDQSLATLEQARAAQAAGASSVALAKQRISDKVLRAPLSGVVAERRINVGEFVGDGGSTFVILQTAPLKLRFTVPEAHLSSVRTGQSVTAWVAPYGDEGFSGVLKTVGGVVDPATRSFFAEAEFPNSDGRLRPGLFARVELKLD